MFMEIELFYLFSPEAGPLRARYVTACLFLMCLLLVPGKALRAADPAADATASDLGVYLADVHPRADWVPVALQPAGTLYLRPEPLIRRSDLMGIRVLEGQGQGGRLVLILAERGLARVRAGTAAHPGLRLALVVGQELLAAPRYAAPIREQQLVFSFDSLFEAERIARAVAGIR
ncbi:hypothetical protein [Castellaniella sp.]|uniref:hypothetical protein n=2 Tax=Castellaniella sp. TaxID=1955812 RepID=UPI00355F54C3